MAMAHIVQAQPASDNGRPEAITPEQRLTQAARALRCIVSTCFRQWRMKFAIR
jgi:hypothetical protein